MEPTYKRVLGNVSAAVFKRTQKDKNNKEFVSKSVALSCSFMKDNKRQYNNLSIVKNDLDNVLFVLEEARKRIH